MVRILIGNVETLRPERVPAEAFERIQRTLDAAPAGVDFHCSQCGALRTATFDPGLLVGNRMTCQNAAGQPACDRLPTPAGPRDPPTYRPGSLVFVRGVPELGDADWPAIVEDDPYERQFFMIKTKGSGGREVPMAYWVTLVPVKKEPRQFRGGFIKAENLIPFMPIQPPPDSTEDYKSALGQATIAFHFNLENRLRMLSFVVNAAFLSSQPPAEPSGAVPAAEAGPSGAGSSQAGPSGVGSAQAGPSEVASSQAGPSGVASSQAGPSEVASSQSGPSEDEPPQDAAGPGLRRRSARIAALKAKLAAQQAAKPSPDSGTSQARASRARSSRRGSGSGTSGAKSSESAASGAQTPSGGKSRAGSSRGRDSRGGSSQERDARERLLAGEYLFRQYWQDLMIAAQYLYPGGINVEDEALAQARLRSMYPHLYHREGYPPVILQLADWGPWFNNFLASFPPETGTYAYGDVPPGASRFGFPGPRREDLVRFLQGYLTGAGTATAAGEPRRTDTGYLHEVLRDYERRRQQEAAAPRVEDPSSEEEDIVPPGPPPELRPGESILSPEYLMRVVSAYEEKVRQHNAALRARTSGAGTSGRGGSGERRPGPSAEDEEEARKRSRH